MLLSQIFFSLLAISPLILALPTPPSTKTGKTTVTGVDQFRKMLNEPSSSEPGALLRVGSPFLFCISLGTCRSE